MINPSLLGSATGVGLALGGSKLYTKATGKPAGAPASLAHIMTNDKLDSKAAVLKEQFIEGTKDTLKLGGAAVGTAAAASLVTGNSAKVAGFVQKAQTKAGKLLSKVSINNANLKDIVKDTKVFQKFNSLPTPAKAGIAAGIALLAVVTPIFTLVQSQKAGYIEGKHEINQ